MNSIKWLPTVWTVWSRVTLWSVMSEAGRTQHSVQWHTVCPWESEWVWASEQDTVTLNDKEKITATLLSLLYKNFYFKSLNNTQRNRINGITNKPKPNTAPKKEVNGRITKTYSSITERKSVNLIHKPNKYQHVCCMNVNPMWGCVYVHWVKGAQKWTVAVTLKRDMDQIISQMLNRVWIQ